MPSASPTPPPEALAACQKMARQGLKALEDVTSLVIGDVTTRQYDQDVGPLFTAAKTACYPFLSTGSFDVTKLQACADVGTGSWSAGKEVFVALDARTDAQANAANARGQADADSAASAWGVCFPGASIPSDLQALTSP